jgi:hypothetical protein
MYYLLPKTATAKSPFKDHLWGYYACNEAPSPGLYRILDGVATLGSDIQKI